jgi:hypothetical protein
MKLCSVCKAKFSTKGELEAHLTKSGHRMSAKMSHSPATTRSFGDDLMIPELKSLTVGRPGPYWHGKEVKSRRIVKKTVITVEEMVKSRPAHGVHHPRKPRHSEVDLAITFDTTGSMYSCLTTVRRSINDLSHELLTKMKNINIGILAHGDYCDKVTSYVDRFVQFSKDEKVISKFLESCGNTHGGDADECYELVLHRLHSKKPGKGFHWGRGNRRVAIIFGDANPHEKGYKYNDFELHMDWKTEVARVKESGTRIYAVHCSPSASSRPFYETIAKETGGAYLTLESMSENLQDVVDIIKAVSYSAAGHKDKLDVMERDISTHQPHRRCLMENIRKIRRVEYYEEMVVLDHPMEKKH